MYGHGWIGKFYLILKGFLPMLLVLNDFLCVQSYSQNNISSYDMNSPVNTAQIQIK